MNNDEKIKTYCGERYEEGTGAYIGCEAAMKDVYLDDIAEHIVNGVLGVFGMILLGLFVFVIYKLLKSY